MRKILIATGGLSSVGQTGGISSYTHDLATNLMEAGYDVCVYLIKENNYINPENVNYSFHLYNIPETYRDEESLIKIILNDIIELNPDIIINNDTSYIAGLWSVLKPEIIKISVMHGFKKGLSFSNAGITGRIATLNHDYLDYIVCQNSRMVHDCISKYKISKNKVIFISQVFRSNESSKDVITNKIFRIMFANGHSKLKGGDVMYEISKKLAASDMKFQVDWCQSEGLKDFSKDNRFQFYNNLTRNQFIKKLKECDIIIIPTRLDTGPMLLVEAMACGVIPICNNLLESAIPDLIVNNQNGFKIDNNNPEDFFIVLKKLYDKTFEIKDLKKNSLSYYQKNLTEVMQMQNFKNIFKKQEFKKPIDMNDKNYVFFHLKKTGHLSKFSFRRIYLKVRYTLELPLFLRSFKL